VEWSKAHKLVPDAVGLYAPREVLKNWKC